MGVTRFGFCQLFWVAVRRILSYPTVSSPYIKNLLDYQWKVHLGEQETRFRRYWLESGDFRPIQAAGAPESSPALHESGAKRPKQGFSGRVRQLFQGESGPAYMSQAVCELERLTREQS